MLGSTPLAATLGAVAPGSIVDEQSARPFLKAATSAGLHVVLIERDGKTVVDFRNATERAASLDAWNDAHPHDVRETAPSGIYSSSNHPPTLVKYVRRYVKPAGKKQAGGVREGYGEGHVNFGLHLGPSGLIVVDADRPSEVDAFVTWYADTCAGGDTSEVPAATVLTPGTLNPDGSHDHRDGGHWYFVVPEGVDLTGPDVPAGRTIYVDPDDVARATGQRYSGSGTEKTQFTIKTGNSYVLIPPSVRPAGAYMFNMPDDPAPIELITAVTSVAALSSSGPTYSDGYAPGVEQRNDADSFRAVDVVTPEGASAPFPRNADTTQDSTGDRALFAGASGVVDVDTATKTETVDDAVTSDDAPTETDTETGTGTDAVDDLDDTRPGREIDGVIYRPGGVDLDAPTLDDQLGDWSADTPWEDVLTPHGWTLTGRADDCGCPTYTRPASPGESPTAKSMTTHEPGCARGRTDNRHPACHVWSDHVDGPIGDLIDQRSRAGHGDDAKTLSKFAVYAALDHDNDVSAAMDAIGAASAVHYAAGLEVPDAKARRDDPDAVEKTVEPTAPAVGSARRADDTPYPSAGFTAPRPALDRTEPVVGVDGVDLREAFDLTPTDDDRLRTTWPGIGTLNAFRAMPKPGWLVDNVFEYGGLNMVYGDSGSGKSAVVIDLICTIAAGKRSWFGVPCAAAPVMYVAGEGLSGARDRMVAWETANGVDIGDRLFLVDKAVGFHASEKAAWGYVAAQAIAAGVGVIVIDTLARAVLGMNENDNSEMGEVTKRTDELKRATGATIILVHHTARGTSHARGASSIRAAVDSEVIVTRFDDGDDLTARLKNGDEPAGKVIDVAVTKQKNAPDDFSITLCLSDRAATYHVDPARAPYTEVERVRRLKAASLTGSFEPTGDMVVTTLEGYPSTYVEKFGTTTNGGGVVHRRALPAIDDTVDAIIREVNDLANMNLTESKIARKIGETLKPASVTASVWNNHVLEALNEAQEEARGNDRVVRKGAYFRMFDPDVDGRVE